MCFSAFAGNPLLISPEKLVEDGLLRSADIQDAQTFPSEHVHFSQVINFKKALLTKSFQQFQRATPPVHRVGFRAFQEKNTSWLEDFGLFMALKEAHKGLAWTRWQKDLATRKRTTLQEWARKSRNTVEFHQYLQYVFFHQWDSLKRYCLGKGIRIIGDLPIYVAQDSAEVWSQTEHFHLDEQGNPTVVAGVPPDYFSATGQRWGNPIYRWDSGGNSLFQWWVNRFKANLSLVDCVRLDHFRGFEAYWEIPAKETDAVNGRWVKGPGARLFTALKSSLENLPVIAEDLGVITPEVESLLDQFGFPGMRILQMAFGDDPKASDYRPHNHTRNCVVYTASHDHNTTLGWFTAEPGKETTQTKEEIERERAFTLKYLHTDGREIHWDFIRLAMSSVAAISIFPLQDILGLGSECRMNRPGTEKGNWEWRYSPPMLTKEIGERLRDLTALYDRLPPRKLSEISDRREVVSV